MSKRLEELRAQMWEVLAEFLATMRAIREHRATWGHAPDGTLKRLQEIKQRMARIQVSTLRERANVIERDAARESFKHLEVPDFLPDEELE